MAYVSIFSRGASAPSSDAALQQVLGGKTNPFANDFRPGQYLVKQPAAPKFKAPKPPAQPKQPTQPQNIFERVASNVVKAFNSNNQQSTLKKPTPTPIQKVVSQQSAKQPKNSFKAYQPSTKPTNEDPNSVMGSIIQNTIGKPIAELGASITNKPIKAKNRIGKLLAGSGTIKPIQQDVAGVYKANEKHGPVAAGALAAGDLASHILQDVPDAGALYKGVGKGMELASKLKPELSAAEKGAVFSNIASKVKGRSLSAAPKEVADVIDKAAGKVKPEELPPIELPKGVGHPSDMISAESTKEPVVQAIEAPKPKGTVEPLKAANPVTAKIKDEIGAIKNAGESYDPAGNLTPEAGKQINLLNKQINAVGERVPKAEKPIISTPIKEETVETPEIKTSKLSQGVEANAVKHGLAQGFEGKPEYAKVNVSKQTKAAVGLVKSDPERAVRIAMGHEKPPEGLLPESAFIAVENAATKNGDADLLRRLATESNLTSEATGMGQRIRMLGEREGTSPVKAIQEVQKAKTDAFKARTGKDATKAVSDEIKAIRAAKPKVTKMNWTQFVESIKC